MHGCHGNNTFNKSYICLISSNTFTYSFCKLVSVLILVVVSVFTVFQTVFLLVFFRFICDYRHCRGSGFTPDRTSTDYSGCMEEKEEER